MRCPYCGHNDTQVKDSRPSEDGSTIRRRRHCTACDSRFTTFERVQLRELVVVKKNGERRPFDRDKIARSLNVALRKRPVEPEAVDRLINSLVQKLESSTDGEVTSDQIGSQVMQALRQLDKVAFIRFASVYKDFSEASDFEEFVAALSKP
jgi:transcriptional repressor NrdR